MGKHQLDFYCHENAQHFTVDNTRRYPPGASGNWHVPAIACLVVEATGRHEQALVRAAGKRIVSVVVAQPIAIRRFAGALGILAKTDKLDSRVIAQYAATVQPPIRELPDETTYKLKDLTVRRKQIIGMLTMEKNRLQVMPAFLRADIRRSIVHLQRQLQSVDRRIVELSEQVASWRERRQILGEHAGCRGHAVHHTAERSA